MHRISPFALLRTAWSTVRTAGTRLIATAIALQLIMLLLATPLLSWLFTEALRANGMLALDLGTLTVTSGIGLSLTLLIVILVLAFWLISLQFAVLVQLLMRARTGRPVRFRTIGADLLTIVRKLWRPSSAALFWYLFLIVPLSGFGFVSVLSQGIAVPSFISGELLKSPASATAWTAFLLILAFLNLRFALSLPIFAATEATGGAAMRLSWRLTRGWASVRLLLTVVVILIIAGVVSLVLFIVAILPTVISDEIAVDASPFVAAFSLGIAQVLGMVLTAVVTATIISVLVSLAYERRALLPPTVQLPATATDTDTATTGSTSMSASTSTSASTFTPASMSAEGEDPLTGTSSPPTSRVTERVILTGGVILALILGIMHIDTMQSLSDQPETLVIGHRGFSGGGAENTIGGLEAAAAAGADLVEIDVMQTADRRFVVMHDANLSRLADMNVQVKNLTFDELTAIIVHDQFGHEGSIPSLEEYVLRAAELDMPLLIEIKLGGLDSPDMVDLLVEELEELDVLDGNIFHTLDHASLVRLKTLRPNAMVGYILAFAGVDVPDTPADFVVIEQYTATQEMQDAAAARGLAFFSWTVNDESGIRELLRRNADGMITDHPDIAIEARSEMHEEQGLAGKLIDALTKFVVVF